MVQFFCLTMYTSHTHTRARTHTRKRTHTVLYTVNLTMEGAKGGRGRRAAAPQLTHI